MIPVLPSDIDTDTPRARATTSLVGAQLAQAVDDARDPSRDDYAPLGRPAGRLADTSALTTTHERTEPRELSATLDASPKVWGERYGAHSTRTVLFPYTPDEAVKVVGRNEANRPRKITMHAVYPTPGGDYASVGPTKSAAYSGRGNNDSEAFLMTVPFVSYSDAEFWVYCAADARVCVLIEF